MFCDPDMLEPVLSFLSSKDLPNLGVDGIKSAIDAAFNDISMPHLANKIVFHVSDVASVNSSIKKGPTIKYQETGVPWIVFVWWLFHRVELTIKDV